jgi:hypothetical protein
VDGPDGAAEVGAVRDGVDPGAGGARSVNEAPVSVARDGAEPEGVYGCRMCTFRPERRGWASGGPAWLGFAGGEGEKGTGQRGRRAEDAGRIGSRFLLRTPVGWGLPHRFHFYPRMARISRTRPENSKTLASPQRTQRDTKKMEPQMHADSQTQSAIRNPKSAMDGSLRPLHTFLTFHTLLPMNPGRKKQSIPGIPTTACLAARQRIMANSRCDPASSPTKELLTQSHQDHQEERCGNGLLPSWLCGFV